MNQTLYCPVVTKNVLRLPLYIITVGISKSENHIIREDGIADYQLLYSFTGNGTAIVNGESVCVPQNSILFLPPSTLHNYKSSSENWCTYWVTYNGRISEKMLDIETGVHMLPKDFNFKSKFNTILKTRQTPEMCAMSSVMLYEFLLGISEAIKGDAALGHKTESIINHVLEYININYKQIIELKSLADECNVSEEYFCRIFKEYTGMRPFEYINNVRIKRAKAYLVAHSEATVNDVAFTHGFQSSAYFSQVFKKIEGISPENYKTLHYYK